MLHNLIRSTTGYPEFSAAEIALMCEPILVGDGVNLVSSNKEMEEYVENTRQDERQIVDDTESSEVTGTEPTTPRADYTADTSCKYYALMHSIIL